MGVLSVVDRMTRTRLNDQRATPNQLDRVNRLIDLLNNSLVRQYVEQRFTITPDREKRMELGRISHLLEKSKNSRLTNQVSFIYIYILIIIIINNNNSNNNNNNK